MNSSFGWDPEAKNGELYHPLSRFILVYDVDTNNIIAFTMYRFEVEDEEDVVYWCALGCILELQDPLIRLDIVMTFKLDRLSKEWAWEENF